MAKTLSQRIINLEKETHVNIFKTVVEMVEEGCSLNDEDVFDVNILTMLLDAYYAQYKLREIDTDRDKVVAINMCEVLLPLYERPSKIMDELNWLFENGYNFNSHISTVTLDDNICFFDVPVTLVFSIPNDPYMPEWLLEHGCDKQLITDIGDNETLADWCFDNLDVCAEDYYNAEFDTNELRKITAKLVRLLIEHGCKRRSGLWMSVDKNNQVSFSNPCYLH